MRRLCRRRPAAAITMMGIGCQRRPGAEAVTVRKAAGTGAVVGMRGAIVMTKHGIAAIRVAKKTTGAEKGIPVGARGVRMTATAPGPAAGGETSCVKGWRHPSVSA